jgi:hypothetical protein
MSQWMSPLFGLALTVLIVAMSSASAFAAKSSSSHGAETSSKACAPDVRRACVLMAHRHCDRPGQQYGRCFRTAFESYLRDHGCRVRKN